MAFIQTLANVLKSVAKHRQIFKNLSVGAQIKLPLGTQDNLSKVWSNSDRCSNKIFKACLYTLGVQINHLLGTHVQPGVEKLLEENLNNRRDQSMKI